MAVINDSLALIDSGAAVLMISLDLSAAFDLVNHNILCSRLSCMFGLSDCAIELLRSYLSNRQFLVTINNERSARSSFTHGVPQGSVLGPLLFSAYVAQLFRLWQSLTYITIITLMIS
jgi:retron-type reverse transcriptase